MIRFPSFRRSTRAALTPFLAVVAFGAGWLLVPEGHTQAPAAVINNTVLNPLLAKLKTQQEQIAANQTKIEAQTAQLKEEIRQAKIYTARGGSAR